MLIILPKIRYEINSKSQPLFFLAGPIKGGGNWQQRMCLALQARVHDCIIACPCRWSKDHQLAPYFVQSTNDSFVRQLDWERHYLEMAGSQHMRGCVVFWLACENEISPRLGPEPYAMDTRGELGEWRWRIKTEHARVVIGAEKGFHGLDVIKRNFNSALKRDYPFYDTIEVTASAAAAMAY